MQGSENLPDIHTRLRHFRDERDWAQFHRPKNLAAAITVEAGELQELFVWSTTPNNRPISDRRVRLLDQLGIAVIWRDGSSFSSGSGTARDILSAH